MKSNENDKELVSVFRLELCAFLHGDKRRDAENFSGTRYFNGDEKLDLTSCVAGLIREREGGGEKK